MVNRGIFLRIMKFDMISSHSVFVYSLIFYIQYCDDEIRKVHLLPVTELGAESEVVCEEVLLGW